jgi:hypothetical protein
VRRVRTLPVDSERCLALLAVAETLNIASGDRRRGERLTLGQ